MSENESFFRKVARFVANPSTDWKELRTGMDDSRELELEKSELKAMIERKRRNDFVRKREFDMLRRVRREGLSPEQLAALGGSSKLDDSEAARGQDYSAGRPDTGVKAKIDEIEQQMVGDGFAASTRRPGGAALPGSSAAADARVLRDAREARGGSAAGAGAGAGVGAANDSGTPPAREGAVVDDEALQAAYASLPTLSLDAAQPPAPTASRPMTLPNGAPLNPPMVADIVLPPAATPAQVQMGTGLPPLAPLSSVSFGGGGAAYASDFGSPFAVEVSEVVHDPELDEAVISFANADFALCDDVLQQLTGTGGSRAQHAETWLVLFDLYRATGQQQRFESLAMDYAQQFGWSAPQWYSLPKLVADAVSDEPIITPGSRSSPASDHSPYGEVGWVCPAHLDIEGVARLRSQTLQLPLPWVFDWGQLAVMDAEAAMQLSGLFRSWAMQPLEMRWIAGDQLFEVLQEAAPTGVRDADPAYWQTRLDGLRLANRADQFDEAAIDYCVTYEVSPPSWEAARCKVTFAGNTMTTKAPHPSAISEASTGFMESTLSEDAAGVVEMAHVELSGQLVGDIGETLKKLDAGLRAAPIVSVSCARLIRVDFIAAGDLLNWVLNKRTENRAVHFVDAHRLLALFFGAMGINEHAKVQVRKV